MKVGYRTDIEDIGNLAVYQVFLGNPNRVTQPNAVQLRDLPNEVVIHCPYWTNITRGVDDESFEQTLNYCVALAETMSRYGQRYFVLYVGSRFKDESIAEVYDSIIRFCVRWLNLTAGKDVVMCLENDAGSKRGTKMGSLKLLYRVLKELNSSRVKLCLDTNHAWNNGLDLNGFNLGYPNHILSYIFTVFSPYVAVVHLNGSYSECGSHGDYHAGVRFDESTIELQTLLDVVYLFHQKSADIPFIIECNREVAEYNLSLLKSNGVSIDEVGGPNVV